MFVYELPVKIHGPFLHGDPSPLLKSKWRDQEVYVLLIKFSRKLLTGQGPFRFECFPANMLDFVLGEVQHNGGSFVRCVLS